MPDFLTLDDLALRNKTVLLRADLNVPMKDGRVTDASRLERLLPTIKDLAKAGAKIVVLSHFGRPEGKVDAKYTLRPVVTTLEQLWGQPIAFADDCIGSKAAAAVNALTPGQVLVLENTRFYPGEEANDPEFAKNLAALGEVYVNDAFSAAHRAHASTEGIAHLLPSGAGRLMQAEIEALTKALTSPERPVAAIIGGSKISTKLDLLQNLITKTDLLILGGGMANTFLAAKGISVGKSLCEPHMFDTAKAIIAKAQDKGCHIMLPKDAVVALELKEGVATHVRPVNAVGADEMILDIGPQSVAEIVGSLDMCKTIVWNGPLGAFEVPPFDHATNEVAICVADLTKRGKVLSVAGGGDTAAALATAGVTHGLSYLSAAGGAFLEWLEGKELPGVSALRKAVPKAKTGKVII
ncbi:MAG: phosphoglycerate kinase [Pseudomonadota bacterium]|nr:phosphoglycerate kinase [Pseudomonadota bacterium]